MWLDHLVVDVPTFVAIIIPLIPPLKSSYIYHPENYVIASSGQCYVSSQYIN